MSYVFDLWGRIKFNFFYVLALLTTILLLIKFFSINYFQMWLVIVFFSSFRLILFKEYGILKHLKVWVVTGLLIFIVWIFASRFGILGVLFLLLGFLFYRLWTGRRLFMESTRYIEKTLFGKPLDKKEFKKGEKPSLFKNNEGDDKE
jgi:hypothetical protein